MASIFLIDDHLMVLQGLRALLDDYKEIKICGTASSVDEALTQPEFADSEILILDNRLGDQSGIEQCPRIKKLHPSVKIIILTSFMETEMLLKAINVGVSGYILKDLDAEQLTESIHKVAQGGTVFPQNLSVSAEDLASVSQTAKQPLQSLTKQELEIARLVSEGCINKEIADKLDLSEKTVKNNLTHIFAKLSISRRAQLAVCYTQSIKTENR